MYGKALDLAPIPPPMAKITQALELTDPIIPGDIKIDRDGKLLKKYIAYEGPIGSTIEAYNHWITQKIVKQLNSRTLTLPQGIVTFTNPQFVPPRISNTLGQWDRLLPRMARDSGYTYSAEIYVDIVLNAGTAQEERINSSYIGKIPVMTGSILCHLHGKSAREKVEMGEDPRDPLGYFIIKGTEKIILIQEKLRFNRIFIFNSTSKGDVVCKMTCNTILGSVNVILAQGKKSGAIKIHLAFMGRSKTKSNKMGNTISLFQIYRMLGVDDPSEILNMISIFSKPEYRKKIWAQLQPTFAKMSQIGDDIEYISKKKGLGDIDYLLRKESILEDVKRELFPQVPTDQIKQKLYMLSIMTARFTEYLIGVRKLDDRDNWSNKALWNPAKSMEQLFGNIWKEIITKSQDSIDNQSLSGLESVKRSIDPSFIVDNFVTSFNATQWGIQGSAYKENITDILKRDSIIAVYAHLTKINTPSSRKAKNPSIRMVQMSQLGFVCPVDTPEGGQCIRHGTPILMSDGNWKKIEDVNENDLIVTINPNDLSREDSRIIKPFSYHTKGSGKKMYRITTINGRSIECTGDHPFLTQRGWVEVDDLDLKNDKLCFNLSMDEFIFLKIDKIEEIEDDLVADFTTVSNNHSFVADGFVTHNCGLVKHSAITNYISIDRSEDVIFEHIIKFISSLPTEQYSTPTIVNGKFMGWSTGKSLRDYCVALRRTKVFFKDTTIVLSEDNYLYIYTDSSRPTRPLLVVDNQGDLVIDKKDLWSSDVQTLLREGALEYLDAFEQEYIYLARSSQDIYQRKNDIEETMLNYNKALEKLNQLQSTDKTDELNAAKETLSSSAEALKDIQSVPNFTHCEMDPTAIFGVAASIIPLANHNQAPRNVYQASMAKQALGIYHANHATRFETTSKCLAYPSRPLFETQINEVLGLNELPAGDMVIVAIMIYTGFNQEDAIIMNKGSIDRGLFRQVVYKTYKSVQKNRYETFARPEINKGEPEAKYAAIGEDGLPRLGASVRQNDCIIGKIRKNPDTGKIENASEYIGVSQEGIVDRILVSTNPEGMRVVKVKTRQIRKPTIGDKLASRYAQKATIGLILNEEDMPYTASGIRPDILINPHSIPSRMTIGKLIEIVTSKVATFDGERVNATSFRKFDTQEFMRNLTQYGYSSSGKERMFNGFTGRPMEAMIFTGPCYYQALRHHVMDKIQMRSRGGVDQLSHQPVGGRARGGGQRFGEMERDAIISHGASEFLKERLCSVSDAFKTVFCSTCGSIAISNVDEKFICRSCGPQAQFGTCEIPYAYKLMTHLLAGAGFNLSFGMEPEYKK